MPPESCVEIPMTQNPLSTEKYSQLGNTYNPLEMFSDCDDVDIYRAARECVCNILLE